MAFQDFDQISERRRNERRQKLRRRITIAVVSCVVILLAVAGAAVGLVYYRQQGEKGGGGNSHAPATKEISQSEKAVKTICAPSDYKQVRVYIVFNTSNYTCETSLSKAIKNKGANVQPKDLLRAAITVTAAELKNAINQTAHLKFDKPELKGAYEDCVELLNDGLEELNSSVSTVDTQNMGQLAGAAPDLKNWLSAVMSYQQTCIDGFPEGDIQNSMKKALKSAKELTSNALAIIGQVSSVLREVQATPAGTARHLLGADGLPTWVSEEERRMLKGTGAPDGKKLPPNVTVAKDGSGNFATINEALKAMPEKYEGRYVIYVKEGIYEEYVTVTKKMVNVTIYGDGSQKTIVTGNKNFADGVRTFQTATFVAEGDGFMAQSIGFRNTAGPEKHQAVAIRVKADRAFFLNCRMEGYQDTVYAQAHRQFYRSCLITGTVDFIFGDSAAIFQNCMIYLRRPLDNQQNIVTAQGRSDRHETTGIVLQNCRILADDTLEPEKTKVRSYLGRPWKEFSRTVVMETDIGDLINPEGWMPWNGDFALKTLYYAEFNNKGAGSPTSGRVKWPGFKVINKEEAEKFTIEPFIQGNTWLNSQDFPVHFGLF
ncbi:Pectinesterase [Bertholletia excelsa]